MFNILVVEDNRDLRELLCDALTGEGYRAYSSSDGNEALTRLEETFFDLIIADIMMPNMDGLQLTEELRRAGIDTPILIVTARDDYETLQSGFTLGADDYMVKPVNVNELLLRVKALLRRAKINTDKKITVGSTVLDFETMSVAVKEEKTELPLKEFSSCCPIPTKFLPVNSLWTKSGVWTRILTTERSTRISIVCASGFRTIRIFKSLPYADSAIRR